MLNVLELLAPVRKKKAVDLEGLAAKLLAGERITPEVVNDTLLSAGLEPSDLQAIIDRRTRVTELAAIVKRGAKAPVRLAQIDAEITAAEQAVKTARDNFVALSERHEPERAALKTICNDAESARSDLLLKGYLSPEQWERLQAAEKASIDADETYHAALRHEAALKSRANEAARMARQAESGKVVVDGEWIEADAAASRARQADREHAAHVASYPKLKAAWDHAVLDYQKTRDAILKEQGA